MPCTVGADSISARGSMRQRKPRGGVKTAWRRTTSAASQQSWPAHAVVCPAGANIVRSPVSLRSTVVPRLQPRTSLRFAVHGCHVGSGLDRSGHLPSGSPFPGAAHVGAAYMRPAGVRKTGARGLGRGPGMPGPYRYREQLSGSMRSINPCTVGADSISARGSMRQRKPRGGVKTAWRRTTSAASQQSWPAHAVVCPAGANIVRSPVSLRSTVVPRLQPRTSLRFAVHGCHVGSGLDRSGHSPRSSPFPGAAHARPLPLHCTEQK